MNHFFTGKKSGMLCDVMTVKDKIGSPYVRMSHDGGSEWGPRSGRGVKRAGVRPTGLQFRGREGVVSWPFSPSAARVSCATPRAASTRTTGSDCNVTSTPRQEPSRVEGEGASCVTFHGLCDSYSPKVLRLESTNDGDSSRKENNPGEIAGHDGGERGKFCRTD